MDGGSRSTVMVSGAVPGAVPWLSLAVTVKLNVPTACGVPEMTPAVERVSPGGSVPEAPKV